MCLGLPLEVVGINQNRITVKTQKKKLEVFSLVKAKIKKGDFVLVNNGFAVRKLNKKEAVKILSLYRPRRNGSK